MITREGDSVFFHRNTTMHEYSVFYEGFGWGEELYINIFNYYKILSYAYNLFLTENMQTYKNRFMCVTHF